MKMMALLALLFVGKVSYSQTCEKYKRRLFHGLSDEVPDKINCTDAFGKKQGWWIYYKIDHNPEQIPSMLDSGEYVKRYTYGRYEDNHKVGKWLTRNNVHVIFEQRIDSFYLRGDTTGISSVFYEGGRHETEVVYTKENSIINAICVYERDTIYINCSRDKDVSDKGCKMIYNGSIYKRFSFADFETEFLTASDQIRYYKMQKRALEELIQNSSKQKDGSK